MRGCKGINIKNSLCLWFVWCSAERNSLDNEDLEHFGCSLCCQVLQTISDRFVILVFAMHLPSCWIETVLWKLFAVCVPLLRCGIQLSHSRDLVALEHLILYQLAFTEAKWPTRLSQFPTCKGSYNPQSVGTYTTQLGTSWYFKYTCSTPGFFLPLQGEAEISRVQLRLSAHLTDSRSCGELEQSWSSKAKSPNFKWSVADWTCDCAIWT